MPVTSTVSDPIVTFTQDPAYLAALDQVKQVVRLSVDKAAAHRANPTKYPLDLTSVSIERVALSRFDKLPPNKQADATADVLTRLNPASTASASGAMSSAAARGSGAARESYAGPLHAISFGSAKPVVDQALAALSGQTTPGLAKTKDPFPDPRPDPRPIPYPAPAPGPAPAPAPASVRTQALTVELRILNVRCVKETNEPGKDEIAIGGSGTAGAGSAATIGQPRKAGPIQLGNFRTSWKRVYDPPTTFLQFDIGDRGTGAWPKAYAATLILCEVDAGGFASALNELVDKIRPIAEKALTAALTTAAGTAIGGTIGSAVPLIGTLIGALVGAAIGYLISVLKGWWGDDVFAGAATSAVLIPDATSGFTGVRSPEEIETFADHGGRYEVTCVWELTGALATIPQGLSSYSDGTIVGGER